MNTIKDDDNERRLYYILLLMPSVVNDLWKISENAQIPKKAVLKYDAMFRFMTFAGANVVYFERIMAFSAVLVL